MIDVAIEGDVRVTRLSGEVSAEDLIAHTRRILDAPDFDPRLHSLVDLRDLEVLRFDSRDVAEVDRAFTAKTQGARRRMAIVASSPVTYGYARAFEMQHVGAGDEIRIFADMDSARRWLGVE